MYNEIVKGILDLMRESNPPCIEGREVRIINDVIGHELNVKGYPNHQAVCQMDGWELEGEILNEGETVYGFTYNFENGDFESNS